MDERTLKWLFDGLTAAQLICEFCEEETFESYSTNAMLRSAVERQFEILGEALKRIRDHDRAIFDAISGAGDAVAFRNVLAHNYDSIDDSIVWNTIEEYMESMIEDLRGLSLD